MVPVPAPARPFAVHPTSTRSYTMLRRLAVGGMGELLLARASGAGGVQKLVAIKRVRSEYASDPAFVAMFLNEARLSATLDHPNIVRTYDLVEESGVFAMVMEYLHGESLGRVLNAVSEAGGRVPLQHVLTVALGVAAGLHCAHERCGVDGRPLDIVHRDLSPGNVFITYEGGVKLLDFGIAKATSRTSITVGPTRKGKVPYMSPEQCVGADVDRRSDIFALGVVCWELCTGRRLFRGDNEFAIMNQVTTLDAPSPRSVVPELPEELAAILGKALQRDPAARFQTAMEMHDALEAFARGQGLLPSSAALGRYLTEICGCREAPSVEPTAEFVDVRGATLVVPGTTEPPRRRWSVVVALAAGAAAGAIAVAASTSTASSERAAPVPVEAAAAREASSPPVPVPVSAATPASVAPGIAPEPTVAPPPTEPVARTSPPRRSTARDRRAKRESPAPAKPTTPEKPVRGVDGLLPGG